MKTYFKLLFLFGVLSTGNLLAQDLTQTIRGRVVDQVSQVPMIGATVMVLDTDPLLGEITDKNGEFKIKNVPVGPQSIRISFVGYKDLIIPAIQVNSGKEVILPIELEEDISTIEEFVVTANEKDRTINDMVAVSGRTFSVEETRKFAAAVNDPGRMATSFSGVVGTDDGNNNISIRGNSPNGLLWRMEGIDIPNPNHFVYPGTSGGGISILSSQLLANSDFITSAFPAEYGNALGGVFDLNLRKGNNENQEFTLQAGFLGLDVAAEGPIAKNYRGSYLVNYRYSTLSLLGQMGLPLGDFVTNFQDLSFIVYLPTGKKSSLTVFGFGGLSDQNEDPIADSLDWENEFDRYNSTYFSNTGAVGVKYSLGINDNNFLQTTFLASGNSIGDEGFYMTDELQLQDEYFESFGTSKYTLSSVLNTRLSARASLRSGVFLNQMNYNLKQRYHSDETDQLETEINSKGDTQSVQAFSQINYKASEKLTFNFGLHYLQLMLNNSKSIEPRFSASYQMDEKQRLNLGYGMHSQVQPLGTYFAEQEIDGEIFLPNENLDLSKSHHFVLGYDRSLNPFLRMKIETYYQYLYQIPIRPGVDETYSILNQEWTFATDPLVSEGNGRNYGVEFTLEQFTRNDLYFLLSASIFQSQYRTNENVWRNTRFNTGANLTFTGGKEFQLRKNRTLGINVRAIYAGGLWTTPIDLEQSILEDETVYIESRAFEEQIPDYFRTDLRISLKRNRPKSTRTWALDLQNATNRKNVYGQYYDPSLGGLNTSYQTSLIPILSYRVEF